MRKHGLLGLVLAACLGLGFVVATADWAEAAPKGAKKAAKKEKVVPGKLANAPSLKPKGLKFGASPKKVYAIYSKAIERDYLKKYRAVEPGIQMRRLDHEKKQYKQTFRLSYVSFDSSPSSLDGTKLVTEFTYGNKEGMMKIKRKGKRRHLFFIRKKLWNVIDVYRLKEGGKWGPDFKSAVEKIEKKLGVPGTAVKADLDSGQPYDMVAWDDGKTWLRVMNWGKKVAISYSDLGTVKRLGELRKKLVVKKADLDPAVKSVLRTPKGQGDDPAKKKKK